MGLRDDLPEDDEREDLFDEESDDLEEIVPIVVDGFHSYAHVKCTVDIQRRIVEHRGEFSEKEVLAYGIACGRIMAIAETTARRMTRVFGDLWTDIAIEEEIYEGFYEVGERDLLGYLDSISASLTILQDNQQILYRRLVKGNPDFPRMLRAPELPDFDVDELEVNDADLARFLSQA